MVVAFRDAASRARLSSRVALISTRAPVFDWRTFRQVPAQAFHASRNRVPWRCPVSGASTKAKSKSGEATAAKAAIPEREISLDMDMDRGM